MSTTRDAEARSTKLDQLDAAIDQVTARMVQVRADDDLALRIASALPERSSRFSWLIPQFAAIAAFAIAAVVWTMRDTTTPSLSPLLSSDVVAVMAVPDTVAAVEPGTALRTLPMEPLEPLEPVEPSGGDHERSLPALDAMTTLNMRSLAPGELPASESLALAPIDIGDLSLTAESFPPR